MGDVEDPAFVEEVADDLGAGGTAFAVPVALLASSVESVKEGPMSAVKEDVRRLADELPDDATWDDVMERVYLMQAIAAGLKASREGRKRPVEEVRKSFGLPD